MSLCLDLNRVNLKIKQAQLRLADIEKPVTVKTKPFQIVNQAAKFHTQVIHLDDARYHVESLMTDLVKLKLSRVKGLIIQGSDIASINISENESKLEYFNMQSDQPNQTSVIECIDIHPINMKTINDLIRGNLIDE